MVTKGMVTKGWLTQEGVRADQMSIVGLAPHLRTLAPLYNRSKTDACRPYMCTTDPKQIPNTWHQHPSTARNMAARDKDLRSATRLVTERGGARRGQLRGEAFITNERPNNLRAQGLARSIYLTPRCTQYMGAPSKSRCDWRVDWSVYDSSAPCQEGFNDIPLASAPCQEGFNDIPLHIPSTCIKPRVSPNHGLSSKIKYFKTRRSGGVP